MAYYTLHAYDADVRVPEFLGLRQDDEMATDLRFAADAENVENAAGKKRAKQRARAAAATARGAGYRPRDHRGRPCPHSPPAIRG